MNEKSQELLNFLAGETVKLNSTIVELTKEFYKTIDSREYCLRVVSNSVKEFTKTYFDGLEKCLKTLNIK